MANDVAIRVTNLSKEFRIGKSRGMFRYKSLRDSMSSAVTAPFRRAASMARGNAYGAAELTETFWALRDVSFEVKQGEAVGVIGRNGAGKSTLLKVLSQITEPSEGMVELHGRVGSLLEVGTGFHPELTGRDNIYLNGAILGMKRAEINRKFDEIVNFAEVEQFIDTPVKHYSSGMYVRLAFAVAAHLEPEILVVDEVLAVGDAAFQKKCLGKMGDVAKGGRTVLFVSHNMAAIQNLCDSAILLEKGKIAFQGRIQEVIQSYFQIQDSDNNVMTDLQVHRHRRPGSEMIFRKLRILGDEGEGNNIRMGGNLRISVSFERDLPIPNIRFGIAIEDAMGQRLLAFSPTLQAPSLISAPVCKGTFDCEIPKIRLLSGTYYITLIIGNGTGDLDRIDRAGQFTVESSDVFGTGFAPRPGHGIYFQEARWRYTDD
ncbi:MAG: ABC transporter ATP-binding protein [Anaerolineae bacterium]|nr:ABC transporter ATP-binding protein [Anaerolineae bacterium]